MNRFFLTGLLAVVLATTAGFAQATTVPAALYSITLPGVSENSSTPVGGTIIKPIGDNLVFADATADSSPLAQAGLGISTAINGFISANSGVMATVSYYMEWVGPPGVHIPTIFLTKGEIISIVDSPFYQYSGSASVIVNNNEIASLCFFEANNLSIDCSVANRPLNGATLVDIVSDTPVPVTLSAGVGITTVGGTWAAIVSSI